MDEKRRYSPNADLGQLKLDAVRMVNEAHMRNRAFYDEDEVREEFIHNVAKRQEGKKVVPKNKLVKILMPTKGKIAVLSAILLISGVVKIHYDTSKYIAGNVANSIGLANGIGATTTSSGRRIDYEDEWGNHQGMYLDYFVSTFSEEAKKNDISVDEFAIFCDRYGLCDASRIEGSSLLGRIGYELIAISQVYSNDEVETKSGRSV